jgi:hypothetical protein
LVRKFPRSAGEKKLTQRREGAIGELLAALREIQKTQRRARRRKVKVFAALPEINTTS